VSAEQDIGEVVHLDGHEVYTGTCSWTDKTLVQETDWYPQRTMSAEDRGLTFVSVDAPEASGLPRVFALTTPDLFVVRFHGRSDSTWKGGARTAAERLRYLYSEEELRELLSEA
jgi:uncharacterized protein YecE (DUF72 family)